MFLDTFQLIVLRGQKPHDVLAREGRGDAEDHERNRRPLLVAGPAEHRALPGEVSRRHARGAGRPTLLIAPSTIFLVVLFVVPLVQTMALAFQSDGAWGFGNFARMSDDLNFGDARLRHHRRSSWSPCRCSSRWRSAWP